MGVDQAWEKRLSLAEEVDADAAAPAHPFARGLDVSPLAPDLLQAAPPDDDALVDDDALRAQVRAAIRLVHGDDLLPVPRRADGVVRGERLGPDSASKHEVPQSEQRRRKEEDAEARGTTLSRVGAAFRGGGGR